MGGPRREGEREEERQTYLFSGCQSNKQRTWGMIQIDKIL